MNAEVLNNRNDKSVNQSSSSKQQNPLNNSDGQVGRKEKANDEKSEKTIQNIESMN